MRRSLLVASARGRIWYATSILRGLCVPLAHRWRRPQDSDEDDAPPAAVASAEPELYCFCRRGSFGYMIGCDDDDCAYEWFHLECVGLTPNTRPRGKWCVALCCITPGGCGDARCGACSTTSDCGCGDCGGQVLPRVPRGEGERCTQPAL